MVFCLVFRWRRKTILVYPLLLLVRIPLYWQECSCSSGPLATFCCYLTVPQVAAFTGETSALLSRSCNVHLVLDRMTLFSSWIFVILVHFLVQSALMSTWPFCTPHPSLCTFTYPPSVLLPSTTAIQRTSKHPTWIGKLMGQALELPTALHSRDVLLANGLYSSSGQLPLSSSFCLGIKTPTKTSWTSKKPQR